MRSLLTSAILTTGLASAASADVTITFENQTWTGFNFTQLFGLDAGEYLVGTLTGVSVNATMIASANYTYADDLCLYVDALPLSTGGLLQVGGFSNLQAQQRFFWANGASGVPGTVVNDTVLLTNALTFVGSEADPAVWLGNGYGASGTSGTWSGSITLVGVEAVPAPGAMALLGLAGLCGTRRRR